MLTSSACWTEFNRRFLFRYHSSWFQNSQLPTRSIEIPSHGHAEASRQLSQPDTAIALARSCVSNERLFKQFGVDRTQNDRLTESVPKYHFQHKTYLSFFCTMKYMGIHLGRRQGIAFFSANMCIHEKMLWKTEHPLAIVNKTSTVRLFHFVFGHRPIAGIQPKLAFKKDAKTGPRELVEFDQLERL